MKKMKDLIVLFRQGLVCPRHSRNFMSIILLLLMFLGGNVSAWGDTTLLNYTVNSNDNVKTDVGIESITTSWGSIDFNITGASGSNNGYYTTETVTNSSNYVYYFGTSASYVKLTLAAGFKQGDVVSVEGICNNSSYTSRGFTISTASNSTNAINTSTYTANKTKEFLSATLTADYEGKTEIYILRNSASYFTGVTVTRSETPDKTPLSGNYSYQKIYIGKGSNTYQINTGYLNITKGSEKATYDTDYTMSYALTSGNTVSVNPTTGAATSTTTLGQSVVTATVTPTAAISNEYSGFTFPFTYVVTDRKSSNTGVNGLTAIDKAWTWTPEDVANGRYYQDYHAGDSENDYIFVKSSDTGSNGVRAKLQSNSQIAFKLATKMDVTITHNSNSNRCIAYTTTNDANDKTLTENYGSTQTVLTLDASDSPYYIGAWDKSENKITQLYVKSIQFTPHVDIVTADFTYGYTTWEKPDAGDLTITLPAHKAGQTINVTVTPEDGANVEEVTNGSFSGSTLSFTAPAAGSNMTVTLPITKNGVTTEYTISISTETKVGQTFDPEKRYSQVLIDARKDDFKSNTNSGGLGYTGKSDNLDYVPGLVAKSIIEAVDYYKDHKTATIDDAKLQTWFNAVKTYGNLAITDNGKAGKSFDDLNAVKIYFGLKDVAASGKITGITADNDAWNGKLGLALTGIKNASTTYAISSSHSTYPISITDMQGGLWHKADYINQMWGDGQYMGTAFLAQLINDADVYDADNDTKRVTANDWDFVAKQINIYHTYAWDNTYKLPHHAFAADKGTNETSHSDTWKMDGDTYHNEGIWARATGWYFMALVDILEQMQKANVTDANYNTVKNALDAVAAGVKARQDAATGLWYQLPIFDETFSNADYNSTGALPGRKYNYLESSASALFTAAYLKAMRLGLLDRGTYEATAKKAYQGFIENFIDVNNNIYWSCRSAGLGGSGDDYKAGGKKFRDGSNAYYLKGNDVAAVRPDENLTEGKALGAFIMAAVEYERAYLAADELVCGDNWEAQKTATHELGKNQTMHITFHNVSNKPAEGGNATDGWHNWILAAGSSDASNHDKMALRADNYDIHDSGNSTVRDIKLNGNAINWTTFVEDMKAGADVDLYVSNNGNKLYVKAVSTVANGNVYTYTAQNSTSADDVLISLMGQNCILSNIEFEDPVDAVTINLTESGTTARVKNGMGLEIVNGSAVQAGETIVLEAKANDGFAFRTWKDAPAGTSIVASPSGDSYDYKYRIDALNASATVQAKAESTTVLKYNPTTNNNYYNFAIVDGIKDYVVESGKGTGEYDMLNFANITGGKTTLYNGGSSDGAMVYAPAKAINLNGSSAAYMKVELLDTNAEEYKTVQVGDVITFTGGGELKIGIEANYNNATITTTDKTYTVQVGDAIVGATTLYFFKNGSGQISTLNIMRPLPQHSITFNGNGNTGGSMEVQLVDDGIATPIADNGFSRTAFVLKGWNTAADGTGTDYLPGEDITLTEDATLYAQWQRFSPMGNQTSTLSVDGSITNYQMYFMTTKALEISASDFKVSSDDETIATVELGGWDNVNKRQTIKVYGHAAGSVDVTVTFKGKEGTLYGEATSVVTFTVTAPDGPRTVSFAGGDHSSGNIAAMTEESTGSGITLPKITPYAGYTFLGWSTKADATQPDAGLTEGELYKPSDNTVLYAVYATGVTIGNASTGFWGAFSDFVKLDEGKSYSATYSVKGGNDHTYDNWTLIATTNNNGHNGDGVQNSSDNEIFCLRADGHQWKGVGGNDGTSTMFSSNDGGANYTQITVVGNPTNESDFITAMQNATSVEFSASRVGEYIYVYVATTCSNGKKYVEKYKSGTIAADQPVYLSWTTEKSSITFSDQANKNAYLVSGAAEANGRVNVLSKEGIDVNNTAVPAGTQVTFKAIKDSGYDFQKWSDETTDATTVRTITATTNLVATFGADTYHYTVRAVDSKGNVLNANIASGDYTYGDPAVTVAYPQHILKGTTLYEIEKNGSGDWFRKQITPDTQNYVFDLQYKKGTVENVVYYTEAENISGFTSFAKTDRASFGNIAHSNNVAKQTTCTLPAGLYQIFIRGVNGNSTTRNVIFTDGSNEIARLGITNGTDQKSNTAIFQLTTETTLYVSSEGSSQSGLDWFYVKKYDDVLMVNENGQRYTLSKDNMTEDAFFTAPTSNWTSKTINGQKEYVLEMKSNRKETVRVTGAKSYEIIVMNSGDNSVDLTVGEDNKPIAAKSTSSTGLIPINDPNGVTTISFTNTSNNTIYPYQIIFYTEKPKATLNVDEVTVKVGKSATIDLSTASHGTIAYTSHITANEYANGINFDGTTNRLTMIGIKEGTFDLSFDITADAESGYDNATGYVLKVNVEKQMLTLKYTPEFYKYNADTRVETNNLTPTLSIQIENEETGKLVDFTGTTPTIDYASDDTSIATVSADGTITKLGTGQGSADITAVVNDNTYASNVAVFTVTIEQGVSLSLPESKTPAVGEVLTLTGTDGTTPLVYASFGGWKWGNHSYEYPGSSSAKADSWAATGQYTGTKDAKPNYVDGYSWQSGGRNDACDEYKGASDDELFGKTRYGWFRAESDDAHIKPFTLPVRGTYMTFEPQQNGMLTVYILQNGGFNTSTAADGSSKLISGEFQPHSFHVADQNGTPVPLYTDFTFTVKEPVTQRTKNGEIVICSYEGDKVTYDQDNGQVPAGVEFVEKDVATWPMFYSNFSKEERKDIKAAWAGGKNGAQSVVKLHDGSFFISQKAYVKYTFYVAASQTYYLFSNFSKMGFAGMNFVPDEIQPNPEDQNEVLNLIDDQPFPGLKNATLNAANQEDDGEGHKIQKLTIPQYAKITVNRTFNANEWSTICLPFDMTEREVEETFGKDTQLQLFDGTEDNGSTYTLHFVYHEIQAILAGYPYLIKPTKQVNGITVKNKLIQPKNSGTATAQDFNYSAPKDMVTFSADRYWTATPYIKEQPESNYCYTMKGTYGGKTDVLKNDLYMATGGVIKRLAATSSKLKGYRAYIKSNSPVVNTAKPITVFFSRYHELDDIIGGTTTFMFEIMDGEDINSVHALTPVTGIYNLSGQKMDQDVRNLPKGMYIINGKKMYVK